MFVSGEITIDQRNLLFQLTDTVYRREAEKLSAANTMNNGRPYTADVASSKMIRSTFNPYQTSYKHEFYRKDEPEEMSVR